MGDPFEFTIKNPPIVIAKQANIANGPQQVNNGAITNIGNRGGSQPGRLLQKVKRVLVKMRTSMG